MEAEAFLAKRREEFIDAEKELYDLTERALTDYAGGKVSWYTGLVEAAGVLWTERFEEEAPNADAEKFIGRFTDMLTEALKKTEKPGPILNQSQITRVSTWLATVAVNDGTWSGAGARGVRFKAWRTMHDGDVRETHVRADGQVANIGGKFLVGGYRLRYPGEPVGPPEIWINCRCVAQPVSREGEAMSATTFAVTEEPVIEDEEMPVDELDEGEEELTEVPVHGVLAPEGVMSGDGRLIKPDAMTWRDLPLPLRYETVGSHGGDTSHVVTVGRVDEIWREGNMLRYKGVVSVNRDVSSEVIAGIIDGTVRGVSIDGDAAVVEEPKVKENPDGSLELEDPDMAGVMVFESLRTAGLTIVAIPAFQEAYIGLGHEFQEDMSEEALAASLAALGDCGCDKKGPEDDDENPDIELAYDAWKVVDLSEMSDEERAEYDSLDMEGQDRFAAERGYLLASAFAPGTHDGPGWITHPLATSRIRRYWVHGKGAAKIRWGVPGDFNRCRRQLVKYVQNPDWLAGLCANMHKEAIGVWPGRETGRGNHAVNALTASVRMLSEEEDILPSVYFQHHGVKEPIGVEIDGDHIYGYVAHWNVCHIGYRGKCETAPKSMTNYSRFRTGNVITENGLQPVGTITMDTGHADMRVREAAAVSHYDNTGTAVADVNVGEDEIGIWFSGMLRPGVTKEQKRALRASGRVSGDWRDYRGMLELVAALAVNVPGFPVPNVLVAAGSHGQYALVAAGVPQEVFSEEPSIATVQEFDMKPVIREAIREFVATQKRAERLAALRTEARQKQIASLRQKIEGK